MIMATMVFSINCCSMELTVHDLPPFSFHISLVALYIYSLPLSMLIQKIVYKCSTQCMHVSLCVYASSSYEPLLKDT